MTFAKHGVYICTIVAKYTELGCIKQITFPHELAVVSYDLIHSKNSINTFIVRTLLKE